MNHPWDDDDINVPTAVNLALWRRIVAHAFPYRRPALGLALAGLVVALADTAMPLITARLIDAAVRGQPFSELSMWGVAYLVAFTVLAAMIYLFIRFAGDVATGMAYDLRQEGFRRLQDLELAFHDRHPLGWLVARLTSDVGKVSGLLPWLLLDFVWGPSLLLGIMVAMFAMHPPLALTVMMIVPPLAIMSLFFQRVLLRTSRLMRRANARITASFSESIAGVRTTKMLAREEESLGEFDELSQDMFQHSMRAAVLSAIYLPAVVLAGNIGLGLALWKGGLLVESEALSLGTMIAFMQYATLFGVPVQDLARQFTKMQAAQAAAERVQSLLDAVPTIRDAEVTRVPEPSEGLPSAANDSEGFASGAVPVRSVVFDEVHFAYKPEEPVLSGCSFSASAGQTVALVGPTGGGKTTIVKLLSRFYDVNGGSVRIDGVDVRELPMAWLQRRFGIVLQTPHLFSGSVADNIRYGRLDATHGEIEEAARLTHADRFIRKLPKGYDTEVGEGGATLSTGQRQLVSLARALLANPQIFVMDEATSSVDTETEQAIQAGVEAVLQDRIAFVIAHRLSTVRNADKILVVKDGGIAESGSHAELLAQGGHYARLVASNRVPEAVA
ncbi:MAG: ABC transporter ATP-binding protein [Myxococcota bacterium]